MVKVKDIIKAIEDFAPPSLAVSGDPIGLCIGSGEQDASKILLALDVTEDAVRYAKKIGAGLIVSHHPLIYNKLAALNGRTPNERTVALAVKSDIAVYSAHTNLDNADRGINDFLISIARCKKKEPLLVGGERVGLVANIEPLPLKELACVYSAELKEQVFTVGQCLSIGRLAVISGGGGGETSHVEAAMAAGAQCLLTGDIKHHVALFAREAGFALIEASHFGTEYAYMRAFRGILTELTKKQKPTIETMTESNPRRIN